MLAERLLKVKKIKLTNNESHAVMFKNSKNRDFFLSIHQCYDHCEKEQEKHNKDNFDHSLFFQCSSSKICNLEYNAFLECYKINKNKCSKELLGLGDCLDSRIDQFYLQLINTK